MPLVPLSPGCGKTEDYGKRTWKRKVACLVAARKQKTERVPKEKLPVTYFLQLVPISVNFHPS
jgi:hypothetical protein